jgi:hypothetical protein
LDILIQTVLGKARHLRTPLHIRYLVKLSSQRTIAAATFGGGGEKPGMTSYIIIQRRFRHVESLVRSTFAAADDVKVFIDRRRKKRRKATLPLTSEDRRNVPDRRSAAPILDILIDPST